MFNIIFLIIFFINFTAFFSYSIEPQFTEKINRLNQYLMQHGVPQQWLFENINNPKFRIYYEIETIYQKTAETKYNKSEIDLQWYMKAYNADAKIRVGKEFINNYYNILKEIEKKNGIHYELIVAILGIETNFAHHLYLGHYYAFNTLVSHFLLLPKKENFAINQLVALYYFSEKIQKSVYYFKGSFAGACGWAQFIPTSLLNFFIDSNNIDSDVDIYSLIDNLYSIENYLYCNTGLNKNVIDNYGSRYNAVFLYNHNDAYTKTVLYIYDGLRKLRELVQN